jgi:hypothetical protein
MANLKSKNCIFTFMRKHFRNKLYSNWTEAYLACRIQLAFASTASLLDQRINQPYKMFNIAAAWTFLYLTVLLPLLHALVLRFSK